MPSWLLITIVLAQPSGPDPTCALQKGAAWNGAAGVSAVDCDGVPGFFVPSAEFRALRRPNESRIYKLLEEELRLAKLEIGALNVATEAGDSAIARWKDLAAHNYRNWRAAEEDVQAQTALVLEAAERGWYESPVLWFSIGAGVTLAAIVVAAVVVGNGSSTQVVVPGT